MWGGGGLLLASRGQRPGMQLNILQCTQQPPTTENYPAQNVSSASLENPALTLLKVGIKVNAKQTTIHLI